MRGLFDMKKENNFAYIDGANLHKGVSSLGWKMDYRRFRVWLKEKYSVEQAYLFIGLIPENRDLYTRLQEAGFILVFKEVVYAGDGRVKGNCDADLVLHCVCDAYEKKIDQAVIVSSDGDYASLIKFLMNRESLVVILSSHQKNKCSILLKRTGARIAYLSDQRTALELVQKEKTPDGDETP